MFPLKDNIPSESLPFINWLIILTCAFVFLTEISQGSYSLDQFINAYGLIPHDFLTGLNLHEVGTMFSSMFLHAGWGHLLGNMWFLYIFGDNVEDRLGHLGYIIFYLFAGVCAAFTQVFVNSSSSIAMIGASGAISGVLGYYFITYPQARVLTFIPFGMFSRITEVPAILFLGLWFAMQFFTGISALAIAPSQEAGGVAFWAHVGGFVSGVALALVMPKPDHYRDYSQWS
jgi:membrane associated rhomboid family serine protease